MAKKPAVMDGFVPRQAGRRVGSIIGGEQAPRGLEASEKEARPETKALANNPALKRRGNINRAEIDESLRGIDDEEKQPQKRRQRGVKGWLRRKWVKRALIFLAALLVCVGIFMAIRAIIAGTNIFQGNLFDIFQNVPLKEDANGRSNIIIVGTSEDDPGHEGASLTDSMMILSINQKQKNAFMISIPRDLYVDYGRACNSGYQGKINEYYNCAHEGTGVEHDRKALIKEGELIGKIFGLDIHYGVNVNYTVMREMVDAVGGSITVNIQSRHPDGILDSNFDWKCGPNYAERIKKCPPRGHFIDFPNGKVQLNAEQALYLAQARGTTAPTYGLEQSNFDREKNQQMILKSLREKAVSGGVLTDFNKVRAIIDTLGKNLRTTFEFKEFRTLVSLAQEIPSDDIQSVSLIDGDTPIMGTGNVGGMSIVQPAAGLYNYGPLQALIKQRLSSNPVVREAAPVVVLNGSGAAGMASTEADKLKAAKYIISSIGDAPSGDYARYTIYKIGGGNKGTAKALESRYGVKITSGKPPISVDSTVRFVIIVGPQPTENTSNN